LSMCCRISNSVRFAALYTSCWPFSSCTRTVGSDLSTRMLLRIAHFGFDDRIFFPVVWVMQFLESDRCFN
jgi:hypothetical protein